MSIQEEIDKLKTTPKIVSLTISKKREFLPLVSVLFGEPWYTRDIYRLYDNGYVEVGFRLENEKL